MVPKKVDPSLGSVEDKTRTPGSFLGAGEEGEVCYPTSGWYPRRQVQVAGKCAGCRRRDGFTGLPEGDLVWKRWIENKT